MFDGFFVWICCKYMKKTKIAKIRMHYRLLPPMKPLSKDVAGTSLSETGVK